MGMSNCSKLLGLTPISRHAPPAYSGAWRLFRLRHTINFNFCTTFPSPEALYN